jgi:PAS domain S-box-containing protein
MEHNLTGVERTFPPARIIVSKTDTRGVITYANPTFIEVSGYSEAELLGRPHSLIRHPAMPRCVFQLLWDELGAGREVFAYVVNRCKNGDHYWVLAHVSHDVDPATKKVIGYHSSRRVPSRAALGVIEPLYEELLAEEARKKDKKSAISASKALLTHTLAGLGRTYEEFVFGLG